MTEPCTEHLSCLIASVLLTPDNVTLSKIPAASTRQRQVRIKVSYDGRLLGSLHDDGAQGRWTAVVAGVRLPLDKRVDRSDRNAVLRALLAYYQRAAVTWRRALHPQPTVVQR